METITYLKIHIIKSCDSSDVEGTGVIKMESKGTGIAGMWYKAVWGSGSCFLRCISQVSRILLQPFLNFLVFLYVTTSGAICSVVLLRLLLS